MTQDEAQREPDSEQASPVTPTQTVSRRVREVRRLRGWSAQHLAQRCAQLGMPTLDRSTIANIESGRRQRVGVDELFVLALALGVAPVHLLVPMGETVKYAVAPTTDTIANWARDWVRGAWPLFPIAETRAADEETYYAQRPASEVAAADTEQLRKYRHTVVEVLDDSPKTSRGGGDAQH